ncbi:iron(III) transport system permease protein [Nocardioides sp. J9]|nr:iron(III) transport system permease protein [Nocardioides sp. J9]
MRDLPGIGAVAWRTFILGLVSAAIAIGFGTAAAWSAAGLSGRKRNIAVAVPLISLLVPPPVLVIGWLFLFAPRVGYGNQLLRQLPWWDHLESGPINVYTTFWIVVITGLMLIPFAFMFVYNSVSAMGPSYEAAAAMSGARPMRVLCTITIPMLRPSIVYGFAICLVLGSGQFTAPLLLGRQSDIDTLTTVGFASTQNFPIQYGLASAIVSPLIILGLLMVLFQRRAIGNTERFVISRDESATTARKVSNLRLVPILLYLACVALPVLAVTHVAFSPFWSGEFKFESYTTGNISSLLANDRFWQALQTSTIVSVAAVVIVVPLTFFAAMATLPSSRAPKVLKTVIDFAVNLPLGVPALVFGFGILFAYTQAPFNLYGTIGIIVVAYVTVMLPFSMRIQLTALSNTSDEYRQASLVAGASPLRTLWKIVVPLAKVGILSAALLTFTLMMHEFSASLIVRSTNTQVLGALLADYYGEGSYQNLAALSLLLVVITVAGALVTGLAVMVVGGWRRRS